MAVGMKDKIKGRIDELEAEVLGHQDTILTDDERLVPLPVIFHPYPEGPDLLVEDGHVVVIVDGVQLTLCHTLNPAGYLAAPIALLLLKDEPMNVPDVNGDFLPPLILIFVKDHIQVLEAQRSGLYHAADGDFGGGIRPLDDVV